MARLSKPERDKRQSGSLAEEFKLEAEDKFKGPTLEQAYWSNPNRPHGITAVCSYVDPLHPREVKKHEGI
jgi:hypothetical protein